MKHTWYNPPTWGSPAPTDIATIPYVSGGGRVTIGTRVELGREYRWDNTAQTWVDVGSAPTPADVYEDPDTGLVSTGGPPPGMPAAKKVPVWAIALGAAGGLLVAYSVYAAATGPRRNRRLAGYRGCGCR